MLLTFAITTGVSMVLLAVSLLAHVMARNERLERQQLHEIEEAEREYTFDRELRKANELLALEIRRAKELPGTPMPDRRTMEMDLPTLLKLAPPPKVIKARTS